MAEARSHHLRADHVDDEFTTMGCETVFEEVDTLPGAEGELTLTHRNREARLRERRPKMGGHVIGTFERVGVGRVPLRSNPLEVPFEIVAR